MPDQELSNASQKSYSDIIYDDPQNQGSTTDNSTTIEPRKTSRKNLIYSFLFIGLLIGLILYLNHHRNKEKRVNLAVDMYCAINGVGTELEINSDMTVGEIQEKSMKLKQILPIKMQPVMQKYKLSQSELQAENKKIYELLAKDESFSQKVHELTVAKGCSPVSQ